LLVNDMARVSGQASFGMFEIAPVGIGAAVAGGIYLFVVSGRLLHAEEPGDDTAQPLLPGQLEMAGAQVGNADVFAEPRPFAPLKATISWPYSWVPSPWRRSMSPRLPPPPLPGSAADPGPRNHSG
jgi:di/tricarboxylate transporter